MVRLRTICIAAVALMVGGFFVGRMLVAEDRGEAGRRGLGLHDYAAIAKLDLLKNKDVQSDMKMTDDENSKLEKFVGDMHSQLGAMFQGFQSLSQDDRRTKMTEIQDKLKDREKEINDKLDEVLSSDQRTRLTQIELQLRMQFSPAHALLRKSVAENLELTDDQKEKLEGMQTQMGRGGRGGFFGGPGGPGGPPGANGRTGGADRQKAADDQMTKIKEVLTTEQIDKLQKMIGPKFDGDLMEVMFGGGGGFGGRGRRNRGGNKKPSSSMPSTTPPPKTTDKPSGTPAATTSSSK